MKSSMVKRLFNNGYTIIESLFILVILAILLTVASIRVNYRFDKEIEEVIDDIVMKQYEAIMENDYQYYEENDMEIKFNRLGDVNHADSYGYNDSTIIVSLGTGRIYEEDE